MERVLSSIAVAGNGPIFRVGLIAEIPLNRDKDCLTWLYFKGLQRLISVVPSDCYES